MTEGSDFDDEEDFGLIDAVPSTGGPPSSPAPQHGQLVAPSIEDNAVDEDDDIYGDIAGGISELTPGLSGTETEDAQQQAERQGSGQLAESRSNASAKLEVKPKAGTKITLPAKLADTTVVYIGELQWWTSEADLEAACGECGPVEAITFFEDKASGKSKGYALARFKTKEAANLCRRQMHGMELNGRKCVVTFSSNSSAAKAAAKAGGSADQRSGNMHHVGAAGRGQGRGRSGRGNRGSQHHDLMPPMPPWPGGPMVGMHMGGLPMPGIAMPPFMGMMDGRHTGDSGRDYKRMRY